MALHFFVCLFFYLSFEQLHNIMFENEIRCRLF